MSCIAQFLTGKKNTTERRTPRLRTELEQTIWKKFPPKLAIIDYIFMPPCGVVGPRQSGTTPLPFGGASGGTVFLNMAPVQEAEEVFGLLLGMVLAEFQRLGKPSGGMILVQGFN